MSIDFLRPGDCKLLSTNHLVTSIPGINHDFQRLCFYLNLYLDVPRGFPDSIVDQSPPPYNFDGSFLHRIYDAFYIIKFGALPKGIIFQIVNHIEDPDLHLSYDKLSILIHGDVFAPGRLQEIVNFNLGKYDDLLHRFIIRNY